MRLCFKTKVRFSDALLVSHRIIQKWKMKNIFKFTFMLNQQQSVCIRCIHPTYRLHLTGRRWSGFAVLEWSDPSSKCSIKFSVGLPQLAYASVHDMSVQTVHRAGKESTIHLPTFHSSPDDIDDILAVHQPISMRPEVNTPPKKIIIIIKN